MATKIFITSEKGKSFNTLLLPLVINQYGISLSCKMMTVELLRFILDLVLINY